MGRNNAELSKGIFHEKGMLFHGTSVEFNPGDEILPAQKAGVTPVWQSQGVKGNEAFATPDPEAAAFFANDASRIRHNSSGHARVYEVEPINHSDVTKSNLLMMVTRMSIQKGKETGSHEEPEELRSPTGFRVKRQAWGPDQRLCRRCSGQGHHDEYVQTSTSPAKWSTTGNRLHCQDCNGSGLVPSEYREKGW